MVPCRKLLKHTEGPKDGGCCVCASCSPAYPEFSFPGCILGKDDSNISNADSVYFLAAVSYSLVGVLVLCKVRLLLILRLGFCHGIQPTKSIFFIISSGYLFVVVLTSTLDTVG